MTVRIDMGLTGMGGVRLTTDAVWETAASLHVLNFPHHHAIHGGVRRLVPSRPRCDIGFLLRLTSDLNWFPDILAPCPRQDPPSPKEQFVSLLDTDPEVLRADITALHQHVPELASVAWTTDQYAEKVAGELAAYWSEVLQPLWDRLDLISMEDIAHRSRLFGRHGISYGLHSMHEKVNYESGVLTVNFQTQASVSCATGGVWLVPSVFRWPWVATRFDDRAVVISYAARGAARVWERGSSVGEGTHLADLLGRTRATILHSLDLPRTTTWLSHQLGLSPSTISGHLSVMTASGLLRSRRHGRQVMYARTRLGADLAEGGSQRRTDTA